MKTRALPCLVPLLVLALHGGCARSDNTAAANAAAAAEAGAKRAERTARFGPSAATPEITWRDNGFGYRILDSGTPPKPGVGTPVRLTYVGRLKDGTVFDQSAKPVDYRIGSTIPGLSTGLQLLGTGGKAVFYLPPSLGYGSRKVMGIPPDSGLIFEVEVLAVNP
jgi:FKBP-type peptidyl-prolyl cis-trans isomerase FklB